MRRDQRGGGEGRRERGREKRREGDGVEEGERTPSLPTARVRHGVGCERCSSVNLQVQLILLLFSWGEYEGKKEQMK